MTSHFVEWVDATQELPEENVPVVVAYRSLKRRLRPNGRTSRTAVLLAINGSDECWHFLGTAAAKNLNPDRVTHWAYLPDPPAVDNA